MTNRSREAARRVPAGDGMECASDGGITARWSMHQTLLALLAVVCVSMLVLQTRRGRVEDGASIYRSDAVAQARGVGLSVLERLSAYPYDGGEGASPTASSTDAYSPRGRFGVGGPQRGLEMADVFADAARDDLDDFDRVVGAVARQSVSDPGGGAPADVVFEVSISVDYAARDGGGDWVRVAAPSRREHHKLVTVVVDHESFPSPLRFGRVYAAP